MDYERVVTRLEALIAAKPSHGRDMLLREIARIKQDCELDPFQSQFDDRPRVSRQREQVEQVTGDTPEEHESASHVSQFPRPRMQEIGRSNEVARLP